MESYIYKFLVKLYGKMESKGKIKRVIEVQQLQFGGNKIEGKKLGYVYNFKVQRGVLE